MLNLLDPFLLVLINRIVFKDFFHQRFRYSLERRIHSDGLAQEKKNLELNCFFHVSNTFF